jgi:DNA mismatch repair protein MutL
VKNWPAAADPFERAVDVLGGSLRQDLHPFALSREGISVSGWISSPRLHRKSSNGIFVLVNRRFVRDRVAQHALFQGYAQRLVKGQFPLAVLFLSVPHDQVDVNVHPAKNEVRFARPNDVHELIRRAVAQTLYEVDRPAWKPVGFRQKEPGTGEVRDGKEIFGDHPLVGEASSLDFHRGGTPLPQGDAPPRLQPPASSLKRSDARLQTEVWEKRGFAGLRVIGQLHDTYILCEAEDGLILVDQHAAHERVLYEQLVRRAEAGGYASQVLLVPETVDLGFRASQALEAIMPQMRELGLDIEPFGGGTMVVKSVPAILSGREVRPLLVEIAEAAAGSGTPSKPQEALDFLRQRAACHGAIRAGQGLTYEQMHDLLRQLDACANLFHCPHGRPTWLKWEIAMIERSFKRTL